MQRIYPSPWTPDQYESPQAYQQIVPESVCANCHRTVKLHRHCRYQRWVVTLLGKLLQIWIARFPCPLCRLTVSYLPDFALTYRVLQVEPFEAFLDHDIDRPDVRSFVDLLASYQRRLHHFAPELIRTVGAGLGLPPPRWSQGLWPWLKKRVRVCVPLPAAW